MSEKFVQLDGFVSFGILSELKRRKSTKIPPPSVISQSGKKSIGENNKDSLLTKSKSIQKTITEKSGSESNVNSKNKTEKKGSISGLDIDNVISEHIIRSNKESSTNSKDENSEHIIRPNGESSTKSNKEHQITYSEHPQSVHTSFGNESESSRENNKEEIAHIMDNVLSDSFSSSISDESHCEEPIMGDISGGQNFNFSQLAFRQCDYKKIDIKSSLLSIPSDTIFNGIPITTGSWYILIGRFSIAKDCHFVVVSRENDGAVRNILYKSSVFDVCKENLGFSCPVRMPKEILLAFSLTSISNSLSLRIIKVESWWRGITFGSLKLRDKEFIIGSGKNYGTICLTRGLPYLAMVELHHSLVSSKEEIRVTYNEQVFCVERGRCLHKEFVILDHERFDNNSFLLEIDEDKDGDEIVSCNIALLDINDCCYQRGSIVVKEQSIVNEYLDRHCVYDTGVFVVTGHVLSKSNFTRALRIEHGGLLIYHQALSEGCLKEKESSFCIFFDAVRNQPLAFSANNMVISYVVFRIIS